MIKKIGAILLAGLVLFCGCKKEETPNQPASLCYSNSNARQIMHNGITREYVLYVPAAYQAGTAVPLMINFHGFGGSASDFMTYADMRSVAEAENFILVYPQGSCDDGSSHWNPCPVGGDNKSNADDFGFVTTMVQEISGQYSIDSERIYAAGYSNGGMMAYGLAQYKSELVAAVASVSGTMLDCLGNTSHPMPVVHFHGTADKVIPYNGSADYSSAQEVIDYWVNFNNTQSSPTVITQNNAGMVINHSIYAQGDSGVSVELYAYQNGGHDWFSAAYQDKSTAQLIWEFVSRYDVNGLR